VAEAHRVLKPEGILFCKIGDYVHRHRFQWAHVELLKAAVAVGFTACDCIVKIRKGPIVDSKWKTAHDARRHTATGNLPQIQEVRVVHVPGTTCSLSASCGHRLNNAFDASVDVTAAREVPAVCHE
jgi:hypothetical protein